MKNDNLNLPQTEALNIAVVNGWLPFVGAENIGEFNRRIQKDGDCLVKFDDGTIIRYNEEHPMAVLTHFK